MTEEPKKKENDWLKDVIYNGVKWAIGKDSSNEAYGELSSASDVLSKLQETLDYIGAQTDEIPNNVQIDPATFIAIMSTHEKLKKLYPEWRSQLYNCVGSSSFEREELVSLAEGLKYAVWAYDDEYLPLRKKLLGMGYKLLRLDSSSEPGRVGHFVAIDHDKKTVLIGLKGTSTMSDVLTDVISKTTEYALPAPFDDANSISKIQCHDGILTAALTIADDLEELLTNLFVPCQYNVLICGHSLGAGTACLLGTLLRARIPQFRTKPSTPSSGLQLSVMAYASPPVLDYDSALASSSFITTVVNNADVVPRMSISCFVSLYKALILIDTKMKEKNLKPNDFQSAMSFVKLMTDDAQPPMLSKEEMEQIFLHTVDRKGLTVPGRIMQLWCTKQELSKEERKKMMMEEGDNNEKEIPKFKFVELDGVVGNGDMEMLRHIELEPYIVDDHLTASYEAIVNAMLEQMKSSA